MSAPRMIVWSAWITGEALRASVDYMLTDAQEKLVERPPGVKGSFVIRFEPRLIAERDRPHVVRVFVRERDRDAIKLARAVLAAADRRRAKAGGQ